MVLARALPPLALALALALAGCGDGEINLLSRAADGSLGDGAGDAAADAPGSGDTDAPAPCVDDAGCPCGLTSCGGVCVDLLNDPSHCGDCATGSAHYQYCKAGRPACVPGFTSCAGACRDFASDPDHCGACANPPCASGEKCENGACGTGACGAGLTGCPVANNRIACVDLASGTPYCGDCTTVCGPDQICAAGACRSYAPATPCSTCPCAVDCARTEGTPSICCPGIGGGAQPICVHASSCP